MRLSTEDLYTLRDALIHAERAHRDDTDPTLAQKYSTLFNLIGQIIARREHEAPEMTAS